MIMSERIVKLAKEKLNQKDVTHMQMALALRLPNNVIGNFFSYEYVNIKINSTEQIKRLFYELFSIINKGE